MLSDYAFQDPYWLLGLLVLPAMILWHYYRSHEHQIRIGLPHTEAFRQIKSLRTRIAPVIPVFRYAGIALLIIALARPQKTLKEEIVKAEGIDIFLASKKVGDTGKAIGIDMTDEMLKRARENAEKGGYTNVEFRKGEIENIPLEDNNADCVISNCVINLSEDKQKVFDEVFRVRDCTRLS